MLSPFASLRVNSAKHLQYSLQNEPLQILRGACPEPELQILRFAQDDRRRTQDDRRRAQDETTGSFGALVGLCLRYGEE